MFRIVKEFAFSASHQLQGLAEGHPCARLHGHNYRVRVVLEADSLNQHGFVRDYRELDVFKRFVDETLDHRHLNDVLPPKPGISNATTAEHLARFLYDFAHPHWPEVTEVQVSETPRTWACYREVR